MEFETSDKFYSVFFCPNWYWFGSIIGWPGCFRFHVTKSLLTNSVSYLVTVNYIESLLMDKVPIDSEVSLGKTKESMWLPHTFVLSRSTVFMREPWKYLTCVCCLFNKPWNSKSGSDLNMRRLIGYCSRFRFNITTSL